MRQSRILILISVMLMVSFVFRISPSAGEVVRPQEVKSKRQVVYDLETYMKLTRLWSNYYDEYPSEYAYANWMYAARYARQDNYASLLDRGLEMYPANPTLLYLKSMLRHGDPDNTQERKYLEEAVRLDPDFIDPWFSLIIIYMQEGDEERLDMALRRLLESGIITVSYTHLRAHET